jgi:hypothetical protein
MDIEVQRAPSRMSLTDSARTTMRLRARKHILDIIDRRRLEEEDCGIGASIERAILLDEFRILDLDAPVPVVQE